MVQEVRYFQALVSRGSSKEGQKENDAGMSIERNGGCSCKISSSSVLPTQFLENREKRNRHYWRTQVRRRYCVRLAGSMFKGNRRDVLLPFLLTSIDGSSLTRLEVRLDWLADEEVGPYTFSLLRPCPRR